MFAFLQNYLDFAMNLDAKKIVTVWNKNKILLPTKSPDLITKSLLTYFGIGQGCRAWLFVYKRSQPEETALNTENQIPRVSRYHLVPASLYPCKLLWPTSPLLTHPSLYSYYNSFKTEVKVNVPIMVPNTCFANFDCGIWHYIFIYLSVIDKEK